MNDFETIPPMEMRISTPKEVEVLEVEILSEEIGSAGYLECLEDCPLCAAGVPVRRAEIKLRQSLQQMLRPETKPEAVKLFSPSTKDPVWVYLDT